MSQFNLLISTHKYKQLFYKTTTFPPFFYLSILFPLFFRYPPSLFPSVSHYAVTPVTAPSVVITFCCSSASLRLVQVLLSRPLILPFVVIVPWAVALPPSHSNNNSRHDTHRSGNSRSLIKQCLFYLRSRSVPGLNLTTFLAGIVIFSLVAGLMP